MPAVDTMVDESKEEKGNHLGLILGIKGTISMNMGTTQQQSSNNGEQEEHSNQENHNNELKVKEERKRTRKGNVKENREWRK